MKKIVSTVLIIMLWASFAAAQQDMTVTETEGLGTPFEGHVRFGYRWVSLDGNSKAGEYDYLHSSAAGSLNLEWDPLPHRFMLESYYLNEKDFFNDLDYAYKDIIIFNLNARGLFHNLDHYSFGTNPPVTLTPSPPPGTPFPPGSPSPSFSDRDLGDDYGIESKMTRAFLRFKTPNFPFHLYAEARKVEKEGTIQQRFLQGYFRTSFDGGATLVGDLHKVSQSREIDWQTREIKVGADSHVGPVEVDYSHTEKRFEAGGETVLQDAYNGAWTGNPPAAILLRPADTYPHNQVSDLKSSVDTVKLHTSHTGKLVGAGTYSTGDKKNTDSGARSEYWNAAGDVTYLPQKNLAVFVKYRHYDLDVTNPDTVTLTGTNFGTVNVYTNVRDSISSRKDVLTGTVRYKPGKRWTLKGELAGRSIRRDVGTDWDVAHRTSEGSAKVGATYRVMNRVTLKGDYRYTNTDDPAYPKDPDTRNEAGISLTWIPTYKVNTLISARAVREKRKELDAPLAGGKREAAYDQALVSVTVLSGQRSSLTASYAYLDNRIDQTLTYHDGTGASFLEPGLAPYDDIAHSGSLVFTHAYSEVLYLTAEASRSYSRGKFRNSGIANTSGIAEFSDLKVLEDAFGIGIEMQYNKRIGSELWYRYREYDDKLDNTLDGTAQFLLATMSFKW